MVLRSPWLLADHDRGVRCHGHRCRILRPAKLRSGGTLRWGERDLELRASLWRERYALADHDTELALLDARSWGKRPVTITIDEPRSVDPGLLLFAAFATRQLASDASASAGGASAVAATG